MIEQIQDLQTRTQIIDEKLDEVITILKFDVSNNCSKMSKHIDFIDNVYDHFKRPLGFICNRVITFMGTPHKYKVITKNDDIIIASNS